MHFENSLDNIVLDFFYSDNLNDKVSVVFEYSDNPFKGYHLKYIGNRSKSVNLSSEILQILDGSSKIETIPKLIDKLRDNHSLCGKKINSFVYNNENKKIDYCPPNHFFEERDQKCISQDFFRKNSENFNLLKFFQKKQLCHFNSLKTKLGAFDEKNELYIDCEEYKMRRCPPKSFFHNEFFQCRPVLPSKCVDIEINKKFERVDNRQSFNHVYKEVTSDLYVFCRGENLIGEIMCPLDREMIFYDEIINTPIGNEEHFERRKLKLGVRNKLKGMSCVFNYEETKNEKRTEKIIIEGLNDILVPLDEKKERKDKNKKMWYTQYERDYIKQMLDHCDKNGLQSENKEKEIEELVLEKWSDKDQPINPLLTASYHVVNHLENVEHIEMDEDKRKRQKALNLKRLNFLKQKNEEKKLEAILNSFSIQKTTQLKKMNNNYMDTNEKIKFMETYQNSLITNLKIAPLNNVVPSKTFNIITALLNNRIPVNENGNEILFITPFSLVSSKMLKKWQRDKNWRFLICVDPDSNEIINNLIIDIHATFLYTNYKFLNDPLLHIIYEKIKSTNLSYREDLVIDYTMSFLNESPRQPVYFDADELIVKIFAQPVVGYSNISLVPYFLSIHNDSNGSDDNHVNLIYMNPPNDPCIFYEKFKTSALANIRFTTTSSFVENVTFIDIKNEQSGLYFNKIFSKLSDLTKDFKKNNPDRNNDIVYLPISVKNFIINSKTYECGGNDFVYTFNVDNSSIRRINIDAFKDQNIDLNSDESVLKHFCTNRTFPVCVDNVNRSLLWHVDIDQKNHHFYLCYGPVIRRRILNSIDINLIKSSSQRGAIRGNIFFDGPLQTDIIKQKRDSTNKSIIKSLMFTNLKNSGKNDDILIPEKYRASVRFHQSLPAIVFGKNITDKPTLALLPHVNYRMALEVKEMNVINVYEMKQMQNIPGFDFHDIFNNITGFQLIYSFKLTNDINYFLPHIDKILSSEINKLPKTGSIYALNFKDLEVSNDKKDSAVFIPSPRMIKFSERMENSVHPHLPVVFKSMEEVLSPLFYAKNENNILIESENIIDYKKEPETVKEFTDAIIEKNILSEMKSFPYNFFDMLFHHMRNQTSDIIKEEKNQNDQEFEMNVEPEKLEKKNIDGVSGISFSSHFIFEPILNFPFLN